MKKFEYLLWVLRWVWKTKRGKGSEVLRWREGVWGWGVGIEKSGSEERKGRMVVSNSICMCFRERGRTNSFAFAVLAQPDMVRALGEGQQGFML